MAHGLMAGHGIKKGHPHYDAMMNEIARTNFLEVSLTRD